MMKGRTTFLDLPMIGEDRLSIATNTIRVEVLIFLVALYKGVSQ